MTLCDCVVVRTVKEKQLELSTPNLVHNYSPWDPAAAVLRK